MPHKDHESQEQDHLGRAARNFLDAQWAGVTNRLFLLEVACAPDSTLIATPQKQGLTAERASIFNGCDLTTPEGLRKTLWIIKERGL